MFTGIVQSVGSVVSLEKRSEGARLEVKSPAALLRGLGRGSSIAVNGCCLTIVSKAGSKAASPRAAAFTADLTRETLERTALGAFQRGNRVNLEAPLRVGDPLSGHQLQGHVEATGRLLELTPEGGQTGWRLRLEAPAALLPYCVPKGSLAVDGISLTIAAIAGAVITIAIIPFTYRHTNLSHLRPGAAVNLETDPLARHLERLLAARFEAHRPAPPPLDLRQLRRQGF